MAGACKKQAQATDALTNHHTFLQSNSLPDTHHSSLLYQVHQDLLHIRKWTNLRVVKNCTYTYLAGSAAPAFDSVYPGRSKEQAAEEDRTQVVIPLSTAEALSARKLDAMCAECVHPETGLRLRCVTVAIVDDDSTTAYYRIFNQFEEIVHAQWKVKQKEKGDGEGEGEEDSDSDCA